MGNHKLAILIVMSVSEQMPLADVKNHLSEVVDRLQREHGRVIITRHGHAAAVVMSVEDLDSLEETLDIMDSAALLRDIRESLAEMRSAEPRVLTKEDALRLISAASERERFRHRVDHGGTPGTDEAPGESGDCRRGVPLRLTGRQPAPRRQAAETQP